MGGDFIFGRIAQDAFDPIAHADEVNESGMSSVKHGMAISFGFLSVRQGRQQTAGRLGFLWDDLSRRDRLTHVSFTAWRLFVLCGKYDSAFGRGVSLENSDSAGALRSLRIADRPGHLSCTASI
jgi:hypothetical protein